MLDRPLTTADLEPLLARIRELEQHVQAQQRADHRDLDELAARIAGLEAACGISYGSGAVTIGTLLAEKHIPF